MELIRNTLCKGEEELGSVWFFQKASKRRLIIGDKLYNRPYFLSLPDIVFRILYRKEKHSYGSAGLFAFAIDKGMTFFLPLPNIFINGEVCMGHPPYKTTSNYSDLAKNEITYFWNSMFDYSEVLMYHMIKGNCADFLGWEDYTKKNLDWHPVTNDLVPISINCMSYFWGSDGRHWDTVETGPNIDNFKNYFQW